MPQFITPNFDNANDRLEVLGLLPDFYSSATLTVFDRYGKLLYQANPFTDTWDGIYNGQLMPPSDYWYVLELTDSQGNYERRSGHFTLKQ